MNISHLLEKAYAGERLGVDEGLTLLQESSLFELGALADFIRKQKHPENIATFVIDRNINYTNACIYDCKFCGFYRKPGHPESYVWDKETIFKKIDELVAVGGTQVLIQGGVNPYLDIDYYLDLFASIKARYPTVQIHSLSPVEIEFIARKHKLTLQETLRRLHEAGLDSLPGGGAEILVDRVRDIVSPRKTSKIWLDVMRAGFELGLKGSASMVYGMLETLEERMEHLVKIRTLQDEVPGFRAFICWSFKPDESTTELQLPEASGSEYLKMVAISRVMLDNIDNIQAGWLTETTKLAQLALSFGANDMGGILMEDRVMSAVGVSIDVQIQDLVRLIQQTGRVPAQRNTRYEIVKMWN